MILTDHQSFSRIAENVYFIQAPGKGRFPFCNGFLFTGTETVLIDAGIEDDLIRELDAEIGIDTLIISHSHPDHIRSWDLLAHRKLLIPEQTPDSVKDLIQLGIRFTGAEETGLRWANFAGKGLGITPLREPDGRFNNGDILDFGTIRIEAIHVPGHLNDHYCFFEHNSQTLITTDVDFTSFGPWYGNPEADIKTFQTGIKKLMTLPYKCVCASHKPPVKGDATHLFNSFLSSFERQKNEILELCNGGKTIDQITEASPFYKNKMPDKILQNVFERNMALQNIAILIEEGRVEEINGELFLVK